MTQCYVHFEFAVQFVKVKRSLTRDVTHVALYCVLSEPEFLQQKGDKQKIL